MAHSFNAQAKRVFLEALECEPESREAFVREHCVEDQRLRAEVGSLLDHHRVSEGYLEPATAINDFSESGRPTGTIAIPGYRILRELASGGMGLVYLAEQDKPRRRVALKVIRPGLAGEQSMRRFAVEAEILGRLSHPGIARIYEAGSADFGQGPQPFFAMEYVDGPPVTTYVESAELDLRARLKLLARICDAVQHAHQQGVIHRDLKPANILVASPAEGGHPGDPRVLDFGIARLVDAPSPGQTLEEHALGTPMYMSPEQITGSYGAVDTRSDVFNLGLIAYEVLVGRHPFHTRDRTLPELTRWICERDPPRLGGIDPSLRGDVEAIVAMALEKDRELRYPSASALADDLRRHLDSEPIRARPAGALYVLSRFVRRNPSFVAGLAVALLAVMLGAIGILRAFDRERAALDQVKTQRAATTRQRVRAEGAEHVAAWANERSDEMHSEVERLLGMGMLLHSGGYSPALGFLRTTLESLDPDAGSRGSRPVSEFLERASERLGESLADAPAESAPIHDVLAEAFSTVGSLHEAEFHLREALVLRRRQLGEHDPVVLASLARLAEFLEQHGSRAAAIPMREQLLAAARADVNQPDLLLPGLVHLALAYQAAQRASEAEPLFREAVDGARERIGPDSAETGAYLVFHGLCLSELGQGEEAERELVEGLRILTDGEEGYSEICERARRRLRALRDLSGNQQH